MLDHLGEAGASQGLMAAIERAAADPALHTPDLGGRATTRDVTDAVLGFIGGQMIDAGSASPGTAMFRFQPSTACLARAGADKEGHLLATASVRHIIARS
jgi:hypothetical protein